MRNVRSNVFPALLVALSITCIWITFRVTVDSFISWVNGAPSHPRIFSPFPHQVSLGALVVSIAVAEQVVDILSYFSLDTILGIATSIAVDANDLIGEFTRPTAGPANPISTTARSAPRSQRPRVVIPAGYGVRRISTSDTAGAPPLRPTSPSPMVVHP